ncbi:glycosyltransferase family 9 protein [Thermodesulfovibrio sp. 3907-1M]|uniref:Glycosyltransferase family 9 protein n=1 Tax=Thermodesulfovibrio autotrophicus TaxID=3118333 RepID=A0AAU8GTH8_9BACT
MKALVCRMGGLGDSILIYPVLEILTKKGYEVTVWGNPEYFRLAEKAGFCKKAIFYEPKEEFGLKIIFSQNREILSGDNSIYINPVPEEQIWIVDYYLKKLGFQNEGFSKTLPIAHSFRVFKVQDSKKKDNNLCIIHPGSGSKKKNPDLIFFFELERFLKNSGFDVFFLLGPAEMELVKKIKNSVYLENPVEIAKTLLKANLYIGLDSGVSHLSSYLGIPSIVIFGPTSPSVWHPIGENFQIIWYEGCKACFPDVCEGRKCLDSESLLSKIKALQIYQKA